MLFNRACRQRLGFTLAGASPSTKRYEGMSQIGLPSAPLTRSSASLAINPRFASSKSCGSDNGRASATLALRAAVCADGAVFPATSGGRSVPANVGACFFGAQPLSAKARIKVAGISCSMALALQKDASLRESEDR